MPRCFAGSAGLQPHACGNSATAKKVLRNSCVTAKFGVITSCYECLCRFSAVGVGSNRITSLPRSDATMAIARLLRLSPAKIRQRVRQAVAWQSCGETQLHEFAAFAAFAACWSFLGASLKGSAGLAGWEPFAPRNPDYPTGTHRNQRRKYK